MIMGSRVRIRLGGAPYFLFSKILSLTLMSWVTAYVFSTRDVVESFSIHTHEVSGSTPVVQVTVYLSGRIFPVFLFWQVTCSGEKLLRFWVTTPRIRKKCVLFPIKISIWSGFFQSNPFTQHSRIFYKMKFIYL